jgi:hypothetical protein
MDTEPHDRDDLARRAKDLYERRIRERVEAEADNEGRFVAVDVESGDYEVADDALMASTGLRIRLLPKTEVNPCCRSGCSSERGTGARRGPRWKSRP